MASRPRRQAREDAIRRLLTGDSRTDEESNSSENSEDERNAQLIHAHQSSEAEASEDSDEDDISNNLMDKNNHLWSTQCPETNRRRGAENVIRDRAGPTSCAKKETKLETWSLFFPEEMLQKIVRYSQKKADLLEICVRLDIDQLRAYIGILYFRGAHHDQKMPITELWSEHDRDFYACAMPRNLFLIWNKVLRFDDSSLRAERYQTDTYCAFREIWDLFNDRLTLFFVPSRSLVVDEQLVKSRCRSPHRTYNLAKPGKYGELVRWVADGKFRYFYRGSPLVKRPIDSEAAAAHREQNKVNNVVNYLLVPFYNSGRNVTGDRYFSSFVLASNLMTNHQLTYIGPLMANKREIPPVLREEISLHDTKFVFGGPEKKITICAYKAKAKKTVFMMSSQHHDASISSAQTKFKPQIILEYNDTKAGVDAGDQMCRTYSTRSKTKRWPVVHFQNLLDVGAMNAHTIHEHNHPNWTPIPLQNRRRTFLKELAIELAKPYMRKRLDNPVGLRENLRQNMTKYVGTQHRNQQQHPENFELGKVRCAGCKADGKQTRQCNLTSQRCHECHVPVCGKHSSAIVICDKCSEEQ